MLIFTPKIWNVGKTAIKKYGFSIGIALLVYGIAYFFELKNAFSFVLAWNSFACVYLVSNILVFFKADAKHIQKLCAEEDVSSWILFGFVVFACTTGLLSVLTFMNSTASWEVGSVIGSVFCILAVAFSWLMVHISFSIRYAHLYYGDSVNQFSKHAKGLVFPEDDLPDYFDFAYFSIVIGMTFQVSDVVITSKGVRRLVLLHSLISFVFNTVIIAMTVSQVLGLNAKN
jgi:uncharacterized membrane protein